MLVISPASWGAGLTLPGFHSFLESFFFQHCVFVALLVPPLVCGAITEEKTRGTLQHLLTACNEPGAIIGGKLLFHLFQLATWLLFSLPVFCFFAGVARDVTFPVAVMVSSLALASGIAGLGMLMSVWCRTTRDALLSVYLILGITLVLAPPLADTFWWFHWLNPGAVLSLRDPTLRWRHLIQFLVPCLYFCILFSLLAAARLRQAYRRQLQVFGLPKSGGWLAQHGPVLGNPVLWREQWVARIAPLALLHTVPRWFGVLTVIAASAAAIAILLIGPLDLSNPALNAIVLGRWAKLTVALRPNVADAFLCEGLAAIMILTFVVAIGASASITEEKEKGTWLPLMVTTMATQEIVTGKYRGILLACRPYVAAHAAATILPALFLALGRSRLQ